MSEPPRVWYHFRAAEGDAPAGITVSKTARLPDGDFGLTEYRWGPTELWFVDGDGFTADERQAAYESHAGRMPLDGGG